MTKQSLDFSKSKLVVIGDVMLDRYWHGDTSRISPEAPVPVIGIEDKIDLAGGAANVALNARALAAQTLLISKIGDDEAGSQLTSILTKGQVATSFLKSDQPTTVKLRVMARHQQLIRLDFEQKQLTDPLLIIEKLKQTATEYNTLIISDYAKGVNSGAKHIIDFAKSNNIKVIIDPKHKDPKFYAGADIVTPNFSEFESWVGKCQNENDIEKKGFALIKDCNFSAVLVTRGSEGMTLLEQDGTVTRIPVQAKEVYDITGAGDTVIAVLAVAISAGFSLIAAARLANLAAGIVVGKLGTAQINLEELQAAYSPAVLSNYNDKIFSKNSEDLQNYIRHKKQRDQKIVMTNGCFDILHKGHIDYLQRARDLGDCLVVAVNSNTSVKKLKGDVRPFNSLQDRMELLAALSCVDAVIPFEEETPRDLIVKLMPDVLVKGGDYEVEQIAGAKELLAAGKQVKILPFVPGCSTTNLVDKIVQAHKALENELTGEVV